MANSLPSVVSRALKLLDKKLSIGILRAASALLGGQRPSDERKSFVEDKTVVITGGSGRQAVATSVELAKQGAGRIILACRNEENGDWALHQISEQLRAFYQHQADKAVMAGRLGISEDLLEHLDTSKNPKPPKETTFCVRHLDLASLDSVWDFSESVRRSEPQLNVLINNGSTFGFGTRFLTDDGNELVFQTNYLSHFLLTINLLELLAQSGPSRIINVAASHFTTRMLCPHGFRTTDPNFEAHPGQYSPLKAFAQSKLANILFTHALGKRLELMFPTSSNNGNGGVSVFSVNPGLIRPESLTRLPGPVQTLAEPLMEALFRFPGEQVVYCATEPNLAHLSGRHIQNNQPCKLGRLANESQAEELWNLSRALTEKRGHYPSSLAHFPHFFL